MQPANPPEIRTLQLEIQRLLGRCLIRLQQYESQIKAIVAHHQLSGAAKSLKTIREAQVADASGKTLGQLVGRMFGSYVVREGDDSPGADPAPTEKEGSFWFRTQLSLPPESYELKHRQFRDLIDLRNTLVHHFIQQHDLWTIQGCRGAQDALVAAYEQIDRGVNELRDWAQQMDKMRRSSLEFMKSPAVEDLLVNGIGPDGTVHWPIAGIVYALRAACHKLAIDGWTRVDVAARWITEREPEQTPQKYGCRRWRHAIHESGQFELRYMIDRGHSGAWYREI